MSKEYIDNIAPNKEFKLVPNKLTLQAILNYSKSLEVQKTKKNKRLVFNLN
ncbi:MAG: hypothetical protein COA33_005060 [Fluviicola sp.]|nr:hypothetical protein [Fluviicola sp.]